MNVSRNFTDSKILNQDENQDFCSTKTCKSYEYNLLIDIGVLWPQFLVCLMDMAHDKCPTLYWLPKLHVTFIANIIHARVLSR